MRAALLLFVLAAGACGDSDAKPGEATPSTPADPVLAAWKKAGLTVSAFTATDGAAYGGGDCYAGQVNNNIDAVVCQYASPELAVAAEPKGRETVAGLTGAAISNGRLLLVVSDPRKADPEGRTINQATLIFEGKEPKKK